MWGPVLSMLLAAVPCGPADAAAGLPAELQAQVAVATARQHMSAGQLVMAERCLERALAVASPSALTLRTQAQLLARLGKFEAAGLAAQAAAQLGDVDPELAELQARLAAAQGHRAEARRYAEAANTWMADLIAATVDDPGAAYRLNEHLDEATARGALTGLVLAGHAARQGRPGDASHFAEAAGALARQGDAPELQRISAQLLAGLQRRAPVLWGARVRLSAEHQSNPAFAASDDRNRASSVRMAALAEVGAGGAIGKLRWRGLVQARQQVLLARRSRFCCLDVSSYSLGGVLQLPLGADPRAVLVGLMVRWTDVFADALNFHHAAHLEGGPSLTLRLGARSAIDVSFLGVYTDFVDTSPSDQRVSSLNRDRVGQRAILGLNFGLGWVRGRAEAMFLNDDADGDAFDALGGVVSLRFEARPDEDLALFTGVSLGLRQYGPVGDRAVIGAAALRTELRTAVRLGARVRLLPRLELVLEDAYLNDAARAGHGYTENVLSVGVQSRW